MPMGSRLRRRATLLAAALLTLGFGPAAMADFDEAMAAYHAEDYDTALAELRSLAEAGQAEAQYQLGLMYDEGYGVEYGDVEATAWFRRAAEQGMPEAQFNLGQSYASGVGVVDDPVHAHKWFNIAAAILPPGSDRDRAVTARTTIESELSAAQIAEAQRLATIWYENWQP